MGYHKQAEKINEKLRSSLSSLSDEDVFDIIDAMLYFGQVAKFRCRSNPAYDKFSRACLHGIVSIERVQPEHLDFEILRVKRG